MAPSDTLVEGLISLIESIHFNLKTLGSGVNLEYVIRVQRGPLPEKSWHIYKRYNDFVTLHNAFQTSGLSLPLPPKKLLRNMDREFIAERRVALQNYLNIVLMNPILASSLSVKRFLDPDNYSTPFHDLDKNLGSFTYSSPVSSLGLTDSSQLTSDSQHLELALQHVSMALRSEANYEVVKPIPEIGWRLRKHYFLVKNRVNPQDELLLAWVEHGPDKYMDEKELQASFKTIGSLRHPYIQNIEFLSCNEVGGFVTRGLNNAGSLRDLICSAKPKLQFMKKYTNPKQCKPLPVSDVALFGHQILEALMFLHEKGLPFGHLHSGNIVIENHKVKLLDIENGVLGLPSYYRPYFVQHRKIQTLEAVDVYCFGHVLFEMIFGHPLHESVCDNLSPNCPSLLRSVLESILSSEACKKGLPTIGALLSHPFFNNSSCDSSHSERPHFKYSTHTKEALRVAWQKTESRLKEEQKIVCIKQEQVHKQQQQQVVANGKSPERSESPNSTSTATSAGTVTPPTGLTEFPAAPPLPPPVPTSDIGAHVERAALLGSICNFNKAKLRPAVTPVSTHNGDDGRLS
uniref:PX domain-containing protein kinase-like protein n=1 Tax=Timema monikensis TaxID=170555 RepID=A0A7R9E9B2_9NEOP|nr:unnamed protein product [Timema monikensis]